MQIVDMWLTNNRPRRKLDPKGVCIHWTANTNIGADAKANRNYFENHPNIDASAHYVVDDTYIVRCIPENEVAWHCGGDRNTELANKLFGGKQNNYLIGIEMCVNSDGDWEKTYQNSVWLVADILKRHGWEIDKILRHYDLTGKDCPKMMTKFVSGGEEYFKKFKSDVNSLLHKEEIDMALEKWEREMGINAVDKLIQYGIISDAKWKEEKNLENGLPGWLQFEIFKRIVEKFNK